MAWLAGNDRTAAAQALFEQTALSAREAGQPLLDSVATESGRHC